MNPQQNSSTDNFFSPQGPLNDCLNNYQLRTEQVEMAKSVSNAIKDKESLVIEAGTGVGKTFAYLYPSLLKGGRVVISTATKNLQDQLFFNDIPKIREALKISVKVNILKGRANYICKLRMENTNQEGMFFNKNDAKYLHLIKAFSDNSDSGEVSEISKIPENSAIWPMVTSTKENCLGQDCEFYKNCFLVKARKEALESEVLIVNHHLFFADFVLKDAELSEILPKANTVIFDEAHQVPLVASFFLGEFISSSQIINLIQDCQQSFIKYPDTIKILDSLAKDLQENIFELKALISPSSVRLNINKLQDYDAFKETYKTLIAKLDLLETILSKHAEDNAESQRLFDRATELTIKLNSWLKRDNQNDIYWLEVFARTIQFNATPISVAEQFNKFQKKADSAWIFTSATLSINGSFDHFTSLLGLKKSRTQYLQSPFNYSENAFLYVPKEIPDPKDELFNLVLVKKALPLIRAAKGRAFILATSLKSMEEIGALLKDEFEKNKIDYPVITQGEGPKNDLLNQFKKHGNAVLIGSLSFWEGIDVRGPTLSLVIIDKLPFQSPGDPVFESKIKLLTEEGTNAFMSMQLPEAIIRLKQGVGRLIRDDHDKGVMVICDRRIIEKSYGMKIWKSLPSFKRTRSESAVINFLEEL
ncbi:MAG: ATP-dependent DNA helicase [Nitrosomonadales bacterium]|nr:ATP-dependent DNA helicase [Nitrosomonadales bacterium]